MIISKKKEITTPHKKSQTELQRLSDSDIQAFLTEIVVQSTGQAKIYERKPGLYFYTIHGRSGFVKSGKFIKQ